MIKIIAAQRGWERSALRLVAACVWPGTQTQVPVPSACGQWRGTFRVVVNWQNLQARLPNASADAHSLISANLLLLTGPNDVETIACGSLYGPYEIE